MSTYKANNTNSINKRVKQVHSKAKFVGMLYFLGVIALAVLAFLPTLVIGGNKLWVKDFWKPYIQLFGADRNLFDVVVATLYLFVLLSLTINALRALGKLGDLLRSNYKKIGRIKQNMQAMDDMGKLFSGSFAAIVIFHLLIYIIQPTDVAVSISVFVYITLAVGLGIHFVAGLIHGTVSNFEVGGKVANVVEEKRTCGLFVYFFRNLIQVAAVAGILYFFVKICNFNEILTAGLALKNPIAGKDLVKDVLPLILEALLLIWLFVMIRHATATTEFNLYGMQGAGMKNFRVFSFLAVLTAIGIFVLEYIKSKPEFPVDSLIIAGIALVAFLVDCIFKSRDKKEKSEETEEEEIEQLTDAPLPVPAMSTPAPTVTNVNGQSVIYQPIYVPVYYPYPTPPSYSACSSAAANVAPAPAPAPTNLPANVKPAPAPAPSYLKPAPAPCKGQSETSKNDARKKRRELKERKKDLKRAKAEAKTSAKIEKSNKKNEAKLSKKEDGFAKKNAAIATLAKSDVATEQASAAATASATPATATPAPATLTTVTSAPAKEPTVDSLEPEIKEIKAELDPRKQWEVRCPRCGKLLRVKEVSPYHRCPACDKVFQIQKFEAYVKKD